MGEIIFLLCILKKGFEVTSGAFFGKAEGKSYLLTLSESGAINGTIEMEGSSHNMDVGLICDGEFTLSWNFKRVCYYKHNRIIIRGQGC